MNRSPYRTQEMVIATRDLTYEPWSVQALAYTLDTHPEVIIRWCQKLARMYGREFKDIPQRTREWEARFYGRNAAHFALCVLRYSDQFFGPNG